MKTNNAMQHFFDIDNPDTHIALIAGSIGGIAKLLYGEVLLNVNFAGDFEALIMAILCGFGGVAGKHLFSLIIKKFKSRNNDRNAKKNNRR